MASLKSNLYPSPIGKPAFTEMADALKIISFKKYQPYKIECFANKNFVIHVRK